MQTGKKLVFVDGANGTTGLRIYERLAGRKNIELLALSEEARKDLPTRLAAVQQADVSILCLPDDAARALVEAAPATARICDASTAHRVAPGWVYGFPELAGRRQAVQAAARVSVPGCHATGYLCLAAPLVEMGAIQPEHVFTVNSLTGYSGGGKAMIAEYEAPGRDGKYDAPRLYGLSMRHKHLPEMQAVAGTAAPPLFCPVVADYYSGMLVTVALSIGALSGGYKTLCDVAKLYQNYYANERLITVYAAGDDPADGMLAANALSGKDSLEIFITGNEDTVLLVARFDNLGKGASGAAVQCMNLMLGLPEYEGLEL